MWSFRRLKKIKKDPERSSPGKICSTAALRPSKLFRVFIETWHNNKRALAGTCQHCISLSAGKQLLSVETSKPLSMRIGIPWCSIESPVPELEDSSVKQDFVSLFFERQWLLRALFQCFSSPLPLSNKSKCFCGFCVLRARWFLFYRLPSIARLILFHSARVLFIITLHWRFWCKKI